MYQNFCSITVNIYSYVSYCFETNNKIRCNALSQCGDFLAMECGLKRVTSQVFMS